jgi:ataxin-3
LFDPETQIDLPQPSSFRSARDAHGRNADILDGQIGTFGADDLDDEDLESQEDVDAIGSYRPEAYDAPMDFAHHSRSYDDEDAALQAALKASMDDLPPDWVAPVLPPKDKPIQKRPLPTPATAPSPSPATAEQPASAGLAHGSRFKEEIEEDDDDAPAEEFSPGRSGV